MTDTIVAAATPPGRGGVAIVRLSGPAVPAMAVALLGSLPEPRTAQLQHFRAADGEAIDQGIALYFPAPNSYTGEAVLELQAHGSPMVVASLVQRAIELGARRAQPGEFTQRAYLNGRLDLAQAEAVADLIDASTQGAARAAARSLEGEFSHRVLALREQLAELRARVEASIDFVEEDENFLRGAPLQARLADLSKALAALRNTARQGSLLVEGATLVIAGRPNAGTSTLMNALAGRDLAIVSDEPGTTRDTLREPIQLEGIPIHLIDTAGLRLHSQDVGAVEREGMRRARVELQRADHILFVIDGGADPAGDAWLAERHSLPDAVPVTLVFNKADTLTTTATNPASAASPHALWISARTGQGIDQLRGHLAATLRGADGGVADGQGVVSARARHVEALTKVGEAVAAGSQLLQSPNPAPELLAEHLRRAHQQLGEIVGVETSDELLGRIFSSFCIGK